MPREEQIGGARLILGDWDFERTECHEVADNMAVVGIKSFRDAVAYVKSAMGDDQSMTVIDNVAEALWERARREVRP